MKHTLTTMRAGVDDETVPGDSNPLLSCDLVPRQQQSPEESDIRILQVCDGDHVFSGNDERMHRRLRIRIVERYDHLVLVYQFRRNGPRDDFAKDTLVHDTVPFLKPDLPNREASSW